MNQVRFTWDLWEPLSGRLLGPGLPRPVVKAPWNVMIIIIIVLAMMTMAMMVVMMMMFFNMMTLMLTCAGYFPASLSSSSARRLSNPESSTQPDHRIFRIFWPQIFRRIFWVWALTSFSILCLTSNCLAILVKYFNIFQRISLAQPERIFTKFWTTGSIWWQINLLRQ